MAIENTLINIWRTDKNTGIFLIKETLYIQLLSDQDHRNLDMCNFLLYKLI